MKFIHSILSALILTIIVVSGFFVTNYMTKKIRVDELSNLLLRAEMAGLTIHSDELVALSGTSTDSKHPEFIEAKKVIENIHALNSDVRFAYIMGQRDGQQFFLVDAEPENSNDYSPPGQIYTEATQSDKNNFSEMKPFIKGPYTDRWGTWFTAYAPMQSDSTSTDGIIKFIGMDIDANKVLLRIKIVRTTSILIFGLLFLSTLTTLTFIRKTPLIEK